ncbi:Lar family restriction alleviation protein [Mesorhizobium sp.]|uniref:Lar family restriction alleviation protein n=1 Tax=Mesorhizobium sp. TaxID=1871066 RepID=UPI0013E31A88
MEEPILKPCPFCGGDAVISRNVSPPGNRYVWNVARISCSLCSVMQCDEVEPAIAIRDWNRRVPMDE